MKTIKYKLNLFMCIIIILILTGCSGGKDALTPIQFEEIMKDKNFEIIDATEQYEDGALKKCMIAMAEQYQIEFYQSNDKQDAINAYNVNKDTFKEQGGQNSFETEKTLRNYSKFTMKDSSNFYIISRIEDTFIYIVAPVEYESEIKEILNDLNY